jgi:HAD superfamily hydrolase (TIGR01509 family)
MIYKAIFFDRDGTLTDNHPEGERLRDECLSEWSGKTFVYSYELFEKHFRKVMSGGYDFVPYKNVEQELEFFAQWYRSLFDEIGITEKVEERIDFLVEHLWYLKKKLYPETIEVLEYFKSKGFKMGVISDCTPSLEYTLKNCGIHKYFSSFTASSLVGAGKPDPKIFYAALKEQGVSATESLYVDDTKNEADGARELGFTSFWLDRSKVNKDKWTAHSLYDLVDFVERL